MGRISKYVVSILTATSCLLSPAAVPGIMEAWSGDTITFVLENDQFANRISDKYYTQGGKITWLSSCPPDKTGSFQQYFFHILDRTLPADARASRFTSFSLGQMIFTPDELKQSGLDGEERPYAGFSFFSAAVHRAGAGKLDTLEIVVGLAGRHSYAEDVQKVFHQWFNSSEPQGWHHQLHDEPVLNISLDRKWKLIRMGASGPGFDFIPRAGLSVGNALTEAGAGAQVRLGWNLPDDYGTYLIMFGSESNVPEKTQTAAARTNCGIHVLAGVNGRAVLRNIFLDGNTFRDSHSVDKRHFVADVVWGIVFQIKKVKLSYLYAYRTKEYKSQSLSHSFGSVSIAFSW